MLNTFFIKFSLRGAMSGNRFLYYLQKVPFLGKLFGDNLYTDQVIKQIVKILGFLFGTVTQIFAKGLYFFAFFMVPVLIVSPGSQSPLFTQQSAVIFVHLLFWLNMVCGSLKHSRILSFDLDKYYCIRLMHMHPARYAKATLLENFLLEGVQLFFGMMAVGILCGCGFFGSLGLFVLSMCARMAGEAFQLILHSKFNFVLPAHGKLLYTVIGVAFLGAYGLLFWGKAQYTYNFVTNPLVILAILALGAYAVYTFVTYAHYQKSAYVMVGKEALTVDMKAVQAQAMFNDVKMKDKDDTDQAILKTGVQGKQGYDYLNALFLNRHKRILQKPVSIIVGVIGCLFLVVNTAFLFYPQVVQKLVGQIPNLLPQMVFFVYLFTMSVERACKAMFYNCDISLLRYGFYREPKVILKNFGLRLVALLKLNSISMAVLCSALALTVSFCGVAWGGMEMAMYLLGVVGLGVFFTIHHLFMYYVFQPYTTDLGVKNPFFKVINGAVYFVSYICLQIHTPPKIFTPAVLVVVVLYCTIALLCIYKFSPKTFKVK